MRNEVECRAFEDILREADPKTVMKILKGISKSCSSYLVCEVVSAMCWHLAQFTVGCADRENYKAAGKSLGFVIEDMAAHLFENDDIRADIISKFQPTEQNKNDGN